MHFLAATENYYRRSGVDRIHLIAADDGGGVIWARAGYDWDPDHFGDVVEDLGIRIAEVREESTPDEGYGSLGAAYGNLIRVPPYRRLGALARLPYGPTVPADTSSGRMGV